MSHFKNVCEWGHTHGTCRCPSQDREVRKVKCPWPPPDDKYEPKHAADGEPSP